MNVVSKNCEYRYFILCSLKHIDAKHGIVCKEEDDDDFARYLHI